MAAITPVDAHCTPLRNAILYGIDTRCVAQAEALLKECGDALTEAHHVQTDLIQSEIQGEHIQVMLLVVHAQDHLMDAMVIRDMAAEFVELYKKVNG